MEHESKVGQRFVIDLELSLDLTEGACAPTGSPTQCPTSAIVDTATEVFTRRNYRLIEAAGGDVARGDSGQLSRRSMR